MSKLPGSLWINAGRWNWRVKLPGRDKRGNYPVRLPGQAVAMCEERPKNLVESVAWKMLEEAEKESEGVGAVKHVESLNDVVGGFLADMRNYYKHRDGSPTSELDRCAVALRYIRDVFGDRPIDDVRYGDVRDVRKEMALKLARVTVNAYAGIWKRFFAWALEEERCSPQTKAEVWALSPLKKNRSSARESGGVRPVEHWRVKRTRARMPSVLRVMVGVQELCGARPGEMCVMRPCDINRRRKVWVYKPGAHKNEHRDLPRVVCLGPRAQELLKPLLEGRDAECFVFSPAEAQAERLAVKRDGRKGKVQPSQLDRRRKSPKVKPGLRYDNNSYRRAVAYACDAAGVERWTPNQLRHACGTRVRMKFGAECASAVLGHKSRQAASVTDVYTFSAMEREFARRASRVMAVIG